MDFFDRDSRILGSHILPEYRFLETVDREGNLYFVETLPCPRPIRCDTDLIFDSKSTSE